jgi:hypothetical protein
MKLFSACGVAILSTATLSLLAQQLPSSLAPASDPSAAPSAAFSPIAGELMGRLDSKTAKAGDRVLLKTKSTVRTADGVDEYSRSWVRGYCRATEITF